ncbi:protein FAM13B isoform X1 [Rissa tridactyla]|uniref:protein FAM13B isoform X1 n=1 Tax=Rissa tridactyla TaxID=75485 RepID=UPI0023BB18C3|nr:protein FAM13B isoform X1 [Rissa tridactyla]XP_054073114.1 protein FAM13B isoform X1 [Rissa tridactyla]XP_054073116.1 protein FAM13B isoform X1 [Rissa tridactyla]XP_054073117.1 protein FAM13B isoform X1 [Rissa tridactyla]XP_054073118.1 protein FAM13B isoform X1 [Rissa tridactyla]XP_054073119.1 protein FAM13B isoform X1 [Rissa tridactyla]XP_054073120.1 protein FAM13B isoform X1 [Rissa tridactyla]
MRKSSSPSLSNCNSVLANKIFGIPLDELQQEGQPDNEVPFIVRHVVDYIEEHGGLEQEGLFQVNGNAETVEWLRQRYDNGEDVDLVKEADVPSAISLLRFFLQELPEPVIPGSLHIHLMQLSQDYNNEDEFGRKLRFLLQQLPPVNYSLLKFLCKFLANVASHHEEIWSASSLAAVFGPDVFHIYTDVEDLKEQEIVSRIMAGLLENYYEFFENEEEDFSSTNDLSSITEQINDLLEEEEDVKLEQSEELPEDGTEKPDERPAVVHLDMTGSLSDSRSVTASTSAHISPISILPASADILERTIRAAVEQHLFDLQSSLDNDLKHIQQHRLGCNNDAKNPSRDEEGSNNQNDVIEDNDTGSSENTGDCSEVLVCTDLDSEAMKHDTVTEEEESVQVPALPSAQTADVLLEPCDKDADVNRENNTERQNSILLGGDDTISTEMFLDSSSKTCDLNANTDSEVSGVGNVNVSEEALGVQVPRLDLKNVSDGDKWEAPCPITFPLIDFKTMHLQREGEDPFPAFKSWQEDSESGEAQLSPQAGRMTNHPLEEDCHPILSHRSLDFGQSQRFLHDPETLDSSSKALSFVRTRRASFSSKDDKREDKTPYQLVKKLQKKIKQFEEQFEKEKNSKPSYSDIAANPKVLKWMTELTKLRKQIKDAKQRSSDGEFIPQTRPRSNTLPKSFGSSLDQEDEENGDEMRVVQKEKKPTKEATLELILKRLKEKRVERCLPEDIKKMTKDHLVEEKTSLQKSLLYYESQHGRPVTREERHIVKPLYDRYRLVKQMLTRASITPILGSPSTKRRGQMLQPIIEGETAHFFEEIKEEEEESDGLSTDLNDILKTAVQTQSVLSPVENSESDVEDGQEKLTRDLRLSSTRAASMPELLEQLWKARAEKKKLRKTLREFEEEFYQQNGRNVQKEDRVPMLDEYREYKKIKAKLRLLEVLISKQDSSKSI